jgi:hypothetical protein
MKNTCNNPAGSQNPEKQPALVAGKNPNGKSRMIFSERKSHQNP